MITSRVRALWKHTQLFIHVVCITADLFLNVLSAFAAARVFTQINKMAKFATICILLAVAAISARKYTQTQCAAVLMGAAQQQAPGCLCHPSLCDSDRLDCDHSKRLALLSG